MKLKLTLLSLIFIMLFSSTGIFAVNSVNSDDHITKKKPTFELIKENLNVDEIQEFDMDEIEDRIGKKLKWKEKQGLQTLKWKIKRWKKDGLTNEEIDAKLDAGAFSFNFLGFLLGFFLSLIGVLIAWLVWGGEGLKSSLIGLVFNLLLIGVITLT